jgi:hypothetical protein
MGFARLRRGLYGSAAIGGFGGSLGLLYPETPGYAIDATVEGGSVSVLESVKAFASSNLVNNSASAKYVVTAALGLSLTTVGDIPQSYDIANSRYGILVEPAATNVVLYNTDYSNAHWTKTDVTVNSTALTAPDGTATGALVTVVGAGGNALNNSGAAYTVTANLVRTRSLWMKYQGTGSGWVQVLEWNGVGEGVRTWFNLNTGATGAAQTTFGSASGQGQRITAYGNGWYRCEAAHQINSTSLIHHISAVTADAVSTRDAAGAAYGIWGDQDDIGLVATSLIVNTGSANTRAVDDITVDTTTFAFQQNPGTMYADFAVKAATGSTNKDIITFSDGTDVDDLAGMQVSTTANPLAVVTAGAVSQVSTDLGTVVSNTRHQMTMAWETNDVDGSFDGAVPTNDATATMPTGMDELGLGNQPALTTPLTGHIYRFVYVPRQVENDTADLENWRYNSAASGALELLSGETSGFAIDATVVGGSVLVRRGTPLSNVTFANSNLVNNSASAKYVINSDLSLSLTSVGDIPQSYDIANSRYGILIEPAATNLQIQSQTFDNAAWGKSRVTVTANTIAAPDGTTTAETLTEDSTATNTHQIWDQLALAGSTVATISIYVKAGTRDIFAFTYGGQSGHWVTQIYDLTGAGDFGEVSTGGTSGTLVDKTITALANGWYRVTLTASITNINPWIGISAAPLLTGNTFSATGNTTWSGNGTGTVHIWGVQAEASAFATSYIPTVAATVTRAVDDITVATSTIPFRQDLGTMYADYSARTVSGTKTIATFTDGTDDDDEVSLRYENADPTVFIDAGAVNQVTMDLGTAVANTRHQMTAAWTTNDVDGSFDGAVPTNDAAATMPTGMDELGLGDRPALNTSLNGHIYRFVLVPRHVENDDGNLETWKYVA